jgi:hypothetical protein
MKAVFRMDSNIHLRTEGRESVCVRERGERERWRTGLGDLGSQEK